MYSVINAGTFDLANYGDLLFPIVLEHELKRRLGDVDVTLSAPNGGPYLVDATKRLCRIPRFEEPHFFSWTMECDALIVGGGDIIRFDDAALAGIYAVPVDDAVGQRMFRVLLLDLGELAAHVPVVWNGVGVPHDFAAHDAVQVRKALRHLRYLSVRDQASRARLVSAGVEQEIHVVPDSGFALPSVFPAAVLDPRIQALKQAGLVPTTGRILSVQTGFIDRDTEQAIAGRLNEVLAEHPDVTVVLVPITTCHGDLHSHRRIAALAPERVILIPHPLAVEDVAAVIAHSHYFVGSSLHGNITAFAFQREQMFLTLPPYHPSKLRECARLLGREHCLITSIDAFAAALRRLLLGEFPLDSSIRRSLDGKLSAHFDRLADCVTNGHDASRSAELAIASRLHMDTAAYLRSGPAGSLTDPKVHRPPAPRSPTISAIIPVFNGREYLLEAVKSVGSQTVLPCELIIVDDGSEDGAIELIDKASLPFPVTTLRQPNAGQASARNHGARVARGEYIAFLDQDDRWYPHHLERLLTPFRDQPDLGFAYSNLDEVDRDGKLVCIGRLDSCGSRHPKKSVADMLSGDMFILPSASLIRREALLSVDGFDEQFSGYEDDDLFIRLFRAGYRQAFVNESLSQWRIYRGSYSHTWRMDTSRRRFATKLMAMYPNDPDLGQWWVRDLIAPRFLQKALQQYDLALLSVNRERCREAIDEARYFGARMVCGPKMRLRLAIMGQPALYKILSAVRHSVPNVGPSPSNGRPASPGKAPLAVESRPEGPSDD